MTPAIVNTTVLDEDPLATARGSTSVVAAIVCDETYP
jgi:hypothetical protein